MENQELIAKGSTNPFDFRGKAKGFITMALIVGIGWLVLTKVLPTLVTIAWNLVNLGIAAICLFLLFVVIKVLSSRIGYLIEFLAKLTLGWIVEWDEFVLQEKQINQAKLDLVNMQKKQAEVEGKYEELSDKLKNANSNLEIAHKAQQIASGKGDSDGARKQELNKARAFDYINTVTPVASKLKDISDYGSKCYKMACENIEQAELDLQSNKDIYYAVESGASMMLSAKRIFTGDPQLNKDAEFAKQKVREKTALCIGQMKQSMEILNGISSDKALMDEAKLQLAQEKMQLLTNKN